MTDAHAQSIAYLAGQYPLLSETFVHREVAALRERGWTVHTAALYAPDQPIGDAKPADRVVYAGSRSSQFRRWTVTLLRSPGRTMRTLVTALRDALNPSETLAFAGRAKLPVQALAGAALGCELHQHGVAHLHCHFAHAPASVGMYAAKYANIPFSFTGHANDLFQRRALLKRKLQRAAFIACISHWHQRFYQAIEPGAAPRCRVIRCGVDLEHWRASNPKPAAFTPPEPAPPRTHESPFRMMTVARLVPKKGIDTLLRAAARFAEAYPGEWSLDIFGDGPEAARLHQLADELGITQRVRFHGAVPNDRVREAIAAADLFVLPCRPAPNGDQDGIPVVLMEAMAGGAPVIAGDVTAIRELIAHDQSGVLVPPDDVDGLTRRLDALASDPHRRRVLAEEGRAAVEREYDLRENIKRLEAAIEESINANRSFIHTGPEPQVASHPVV